MLLRATAAFITLSFFGLGGDSVNFDKLKPGTLPPNWTIAATQPLPAPRWEVRQDAMPPSRPNALAQLSANLSDGDFSFAIFDKDVCRDGDLSVKFKIAPGARRIKSAGMVWRYQDPRNYYLLRFSVEARNIALFRVQDGHLRPLSTPAPHDLRTGQWYAAKVVFRGAHFRVLFDNRQLFDAGDDAASVPGRTGLWTRAGTVASFDDFRIDKKD